MPTILTAGYLLTVCLANTRAGHVPALVMVSLITLLTIKNIFFYKFDKTFFVLFIAYVSAGLISVVANGGKGVDYIIVFFLNIFTLIYISNHIFNISWLRNIFGLLVVINVLLIPVPGLYNVGQYYGVMSSPNYLIYPILTYLMFLYFDSGRLAKIIAVGMSGLILFFAGSRAAPITLSVFLLTYYYYTLGGRKRKIIVGLSILLAVVSIAYYQELLVSSVENVDLAGRDRIWSAALKGALENPLGVGLGQSPEYMYHAIGKAVTAHNAPLGWYLEGGFFFFLTAIVLLVYVFLHTRTASARAALLAALVAHFFEGATLLGLSLSSIMMILPYFIDKSVRQGRLRDYERSTRQSASTAQSGKASDRSPGIRHNG